MYYEKAIEFDSLYRATKKCCNGVRWKDSVTGFEWNEMRNILTLRRNLLNGTYKIDRYTRFQIHEPKTRDIVATRIKDRILQRSLCDNGLYKDITEHFIYDNAACQKGRGTDFALKRMKAHLRQYYAEHGQEGWYLKCDIKKYFANIYHDVAKAAIQKRVKDEQVVQRVLEIIDSYGERGIGLGSQISQLIALSVLDDLDHFIKEKLGIRHYERYMDDFVLIHQSKEVLLRCRDAIEAFLTEIGLELNGKTTLQPLKSGITYLKWRFILTQSGRILMRLPRGRLAKNLRGLRKLYTLERAGLRPPGSTVKRAKGHIAHYKRGDTFRERCAIFALLKEYGIYNEGDWKHGRKQERGSVGTDAGFCPQNEARAG